MNSHYLNAPSRSAWFCPGCQRYHAPHCDSCPAPSQFGVNPLLPVVRPPWGPARTGDPMQPMFTSGGYGIGATAIGGLTGSAH